MGLLERFEKHRDHLSKTDIALANELLANPVDSALWRGEDLAKRVSVHPAAATRFAQKLGYEGYLALRADLQQDREETLTGAGDRFRLLLGDAEESSVLDTVIRTELEALSAIPKFVGQSQIDRVADAIEKSANIFVFASGHASGLGEILARRLRRFGFPVIKVHGTERDVAETVLAMGPKDCVVAFAFRRPPATLASLMQQAAATKATSILITDTLRTSLPTPTLTLAAPRGTNDGFNSLGVPTALTNALVLTIAERYPARLSTLDHLQETLNRHS